MGLWGAGSGERPGAAWPSQWCCAHTRLLCACQGSFQEADTGEGQGVPVTLGMSVNHVGGHSPWVDALFFTERIRSEEAGRLIRL